MRENQINKRTAGKKIILLKIKQQAPFPLFLPFSLALIFLQFIPIFLGSSMLPPCPLTLHTFLTRLLSNYTLTRYINFRFPSSSFSSSFLHLRHLLFDFMAGHIFNLAPLSPLSDAPLLASLPPSSSPPTPPTPPLLPSLPPVQN